MSKRTWKKQIEEESMKVGLRREDAHCRSKWSVFCKSDCCCAKVNLATRLCWGYDQILDIGLSAHNILQLVHNTHC